MVVPFDPPQHANTEAEAALCGAMMVENKIIDGVADRLSPEDFSDDFFGKVFSVIVRERNLGRSVNPITLKPYFEAEGFAVLCGLTGSGVQVLAARDHAEQIRSLAQRRRLVGGLGEAINEAIDPAKSVQDVASLAESALSSLSDEEAGTEELSGADCIKLVLEAGEEDRHAGVKAGMDALDAVLGPLRPKSFNIVAGRPGMGKSATAISYAIGAARNGHGVLFISLEMAADEIGERIVSDMCFDSDRTRIPFNAITSGNLTNDQKRSIARAYDEMQSLPLAIVDTSGATCGKIDRLVRRYARRMAAKGQKLELVIVDYMGLVRPDRERSKTYEEVSEISRSLKGTAKRHAVAVMALCQLSRKVEERADKRPNQADLRDSGQIEQDADSILFLFAPEYYLAQAEPNPKDEDAHAKWESLMHEDAGRLDFIVAKRRRGPAGTGRGMFYRHYQAVRG